MGDRLYLNNRSNGNLITKLLSKLGQVIHKKINGRGGGELTKDSSIPLEPYKPQNIASPFVPQGDIKTLACT